MKKKILSFVIPLIMLTVVFLFKEVLTGKYTIMISDLEFQYYSLLTCFKSILTNQYSFFVGFGSGMIGTFAYYLASPLNLLIYLIGNVDLLVIILIFVKISLCGFTMYSFLRYHFDEKYLLIFSTTYALSLFNVANYFQIIWLDGILLAPLVLLGIDKLIKENKPLLYGITLFLMILTNYYIGYMGCIFSVLYFIYRSILTKNKKVLPFIITSFLAGMMSMFLTLPTFMELLSIDRTATNTALFNSDILGMLSKTFIGSHNKDFVLNINHPFLYCGLFIFPLILFYFADKDISKKERLLSFGFLLIFAISIVVEPINNIWHAFTNPIGYNFRYIFLLNIFALYLACKSMQRIEQVNLKKYLLCMILYCALAFLVMHRGMLELHFIYISVALLGIYLFLMYNLNFKNFHKIFMLLCLVELYFNCHIVFVGIPLNYNFYRDGRKEEKTDTINYLKEYDDSLFYRMEFYTKQHFVDSLTYHYNGASSWLSSISYNEEFYKKIGYYTGQNIYLHSSYVLLDSLLGIKYYETPHINNYYNLLKTTNVSFYNGFLYNRNDSQNNIYENPYALSLGYMINSKDDIECTNIFECQNALLSNMTGLDLNTYTVSNIEIKDGKIYIDPINEDDFYIYYEPVINSESFQYYLYINDEQYQLYTYPNIINLIQVENSEDEYYINFKLIDGSVGFNNMLVGYFDIEEFKKGYDALKNNQLQITEFKDNHIVGNINVTDNTVLFLSIPYQKGFNIYVDGIKTEYYSLYDNFIGLDLTSGYHDIEIKYEVPYLKTGIAISFVSTILFGLYNYKKYKENVNKM